MPGVSTLVGDATDTKTMEAAAAGQDAVIDTVGGKTPYKRTTLETSIATTIIAAMRVHGVGRLVVTSVIGVGDSIANTPFTTKVLLKTFLRGAKSDKAAMESEVRGSGLDWVVVRPPVLTEKHGTGDITVFPPGSRDRAHSISRTDLAEFLVSQLTSDDYLGKAVTIANPHPPSGLRLPR